MLQAFHPLGFVCSLFLFFIRFLASFNLELLLDSFRLTFIECLCLSTNGLLSMVFEHLNDLFDLKDLASNFTQLLQASSFHVIIHIIRLIAWALGSSRLLILAKPFESIWPIAMHEF
jgi:hypothetical protein